MKPGDRILKFFIAPCTDVDLVEYSNFSQSSIVYDVNSGILGENWNVSAVTLDIWYSPLYSLSTNLNSE